MTNRTAPPASASIALCSLATISHRPQAELALSSLSLRTESPRRFLMQIDGPDIDIAEARHMVLRIEDCIPNAILASMRQRYNAAELCFAAKPFLLRHLLEQGFDQVHYLDGDCYGYAALDPLTQQLATADLLLTPHSLSPIPDDGQTPRPLSLLRAGVFNGGYLAVRRTAQGQAFVDWLCEMTRDYARNAPHEGMCGDQRWLDLVPVLFPGLAICRHPGANVAYWNLHERPLSQDETGQFRVGDQPLLFFHFSGFDPLQPQALSKYQSRHASAQNPALTALLQDYAQMLMANGFVSPAVRGRRWWNRLLGC